MNTLEKSFVSAAGLLLALGLLMVYSASITSRPTEFEAVYLSRQLLFVGVALAVATGASLVPSRVWRRWSPWGLAAVVLLLLLVLLPSVGVSVKGARRWLRLGSFSLQPSELAKIALPLVVCRVAANGGWRRQSWWRHLVLVAVPTALTAGLVIVEPDLGTALFLMATTGLALYFSGWPITRFLWLAVAALPLLAGAVALKPYQLARVRGFVAAWQDFSQAPYQLRQSLTTLGSGGLLGVGVGQGQQKLSFLPEANTDFVFAVIGEELGLLGTVGVILLWSGVFLLGVRLLSRTPAGDFEHAAGMTLLCGLVLQAALNLCVVLALVPPKGISLPLISYGGSSLVTSLLTLGMVLSLSRGAAEWRDELSSRSDDSAGPVESSFLNDVAASVRN